MIQRFRHIIFAAFLLLGNGLFSQTYPVQTFVQVSPPHTSYLPDYANASSNQMKLFLTLTDFSAPSYQVKLRFTFTGNGYTITTSSLLNLPIINLSPGVPLEISGNDLAPYLSSQNLIFSGVDVADYELRKILPEGPCQICVEVIDFSNPNQAVLSGPNACSQVWFSLSDPPLLNTPFCGNELSVTDPQQIVFSWSPLHMNSIHASGTLYTFELFEIRPDGADPNQVVTSTLPIFIQTTEQTIINYGITEPPLQVGMSYAWRIKAHDIDGRDFFRNNGYSAVCTFTYGNVAASLADGITLNLNANGTGAYYGTAYWNGSSTFDSYKLEIRKTGNADYTWFPYTTTESELRIYQLEASTEYECRVKGLIGDDYESEWSNVATFTTQPVPNYACGSTTMPASSPNMVPLKNAISGMTFTIGQFDLFITQIEPVTPGLQNGHYKGTGRITVAFLYNVRVSFQDILVDENLLVREGKVEAITQGIDAWVDGFIPEPDFYVDGAIENFQWNDSTSLTIFIDGQPQTFDFPENGQLVIQDSDGMIYIFSADGTFQIISTLIYANESLAATKDYRVNFEKDANQVYGFDKKKHGAWVHDYEVILLQDSTNYFVAYKSLAPDEEDFVMAEIISPQPLSGLSFVAERNGQQSPLSATEINDSTYRITLNNFSESFFVYAIHNGNKIGKLWVKVLPKIEREIVLVPVNGAELSLTNSQLQTQINEIFIQANVEVSITQAQNFQSTTWDLNQDGKLQNGDVNLMSHYSEEMRTLRNEFFAQDTSIHTNKYYLFIIPEFYETELAGYMVRGKAVGFLKAGENAITAAHELAHGIFALEHTFPEVAQGTTQNLMDYSGSNAKHLREKQWHQIHQPLPAWSMFDEEESGESVTVVGIIPESMRNPDGSMTFVSPSGFLISLPENASNISFSTLDPLFIGKNYSRAAPIGTLISFDITIENTVKEFRFQRVGNNMTYQSNSSETYVDSITMDIKPYDVIVGFPFFQGEFYSQLYYIKITSGTLKDDLDILYSNPESPKEIQDFDILETGYIDRYSVIECLFGLESLELENQEYLANNDDISNSQINPSLNGWQTVFNKSPNCVLNCILDPIPSQLGMQYLSQQSEFTKKGNPLGVMIISNALWISELENKGLLGYFSCYVPSNPLTGYLAISQLVKSLNLQSQNVQDAQAPYYDFSQTTEFFKFYERLQLEFQIFEQAEEISQDINQFIGNNLNNELFLIGYLVQIIKENECVLGQINLSNRKALFEILVANDAWWYEEGENLLVALYETTLDSKKIEIIKYFKSEGLMFQIYDQLFQTLDFFDADDFNAITELYDLFEQDYLSNPSHFQVNGQKKEMHFQGSEVSIFLNNTPSSQLHSSMPIEFSMPANYIVHQDYREFPIFIGTETGAFKIYDGEGYEESIYAILSADETPFYLGNDNMFHVSGNYKLSSFRDNVLPPIENIYVEANKSENVFFTNYDDYKIDPFELVEVVFTSNYASQGYDAHQNILVPAFKLILIEKAIRLHHTEYITRTIINGVEIGVGILAAFTAPVTMGGSLEIFAGIVASLDQVVTEDMYSGNSNDFNSDFYQNWTKLKSTFDVGFGVIQSPALVSGFVNATKSAFRKTRSIGLAIMMNRYIRKVKYIDDLADGVEKTKIIQYEECFRQGKTWDEMAPFYYGVDELTGVAIIDDFLATSPNILYLNNSDIPSGYQMFNLNGSKYIRRVDVSNASTPRLMVNQDGIIVKYNKPFRPNNQPTFIKNLNELYGPMPLNHQRHHLVPVNVVQNSSLHQEAISRGLYSVDRGSNGKYLAETDEDYIFGYESEKYPTHFGSHPNYDIEITNAIDDILNVHGVLPSQVNGLSDVKLIEIIDDIEEEALSILEDWLPSKLN